MTNRIFTNIIVDQFIIDFRKRNSADTSTYRLASVLTTSTGTNSAFTNSSVRNQIDTASRSLAATLSRAGGAFASQTPSALSPTSSIRPQQRPINTQTSVPERRPPTRPGQDVLSNAAIIARRDRQSRSRGAASGRTTT
jgi:hypothetical protein